MSEENSEENNELSLSEILRLYEQRREEGKTARNPFKFLDAYGPEDRDIFFGRDYEIQEALWHYHKGSHFVVYGESGSGKSSLIACGLRANIPREDAAFIATRCYSEPIAALTAAIHSAIGKGSGAERGGHNAAEASTDQDGPSGQAVQAAQSAQIGKAGEAAHLLRLLKDAAEHFACPIVLFFDQFEELFIFHDEPVRKSFALALRDILDARSGVKIVFAVRQEYLAHLSELERYVPALFENRLWLRRMSPETATRAIIEACQVCSVNIEAELPAQIVQRLSPKGQGVELPYLQVVMDRLYHKAVGINPENPILTIESYRAEGEIKDILARFLEESVASLPNPDLGRQVLKTMITSEGTRRMLDKDKIQAEAENFGEPVKESDLTDLLNIFLNLRILKEDPESKAYELRHDTLAHTVFAWMTGLEKELMEIRDTLKSRLREYQTRHADTAALLDKSFLAYIAPYENRLFLPEPQRDFISASKREYERKRKRGRYLAFGATALAFLVLALFTGWNMVERGRAVEQKGVAEKQRQLAEDREKDAETQKAKAEEARKTAELEKARAEEARQNAELQKKFAESQQQIATAQKKLAEGKTREAETQLAEARHNLGLVFLSKSDLALRPDNLNYNANRIYCLYALKYLKAAAPERAEAYGHILSYPVYPLIGSFAGHSDTVRCVNFSPDGKTIASGGNDNTIKLWDVATGRNTATLNGHIDNVRSVNFSPDGRTIASGSLDSTVKLWDVATGRNILTLTGHSGWVDSVNFSPDGKTIVSGSWDETIKLWNVATGRNIATLTGHSSGVSSVNFSPDGKTIVSGGMQDHTIKLWDLATARNTATLSGHRYIINSVNFSPDGKTVVSTSDDV